MIEEWCCQVELGIYDVKSLYAVICYAFETWPGSPSTSCRGAGVSETHQEPTVCNAC